MALPFIGLGLGGLKAITSLINKGKINDQIDELEKNRPKYSINQESKDELSLAESELSNGMSGNAERAYNNMVGSDFANSLDAILKSGGSVNNVGALYGAKEEGRQKLALMEDEIRMRQLNNLILARRNMADQKDKAFEFNEWMPWSDKAQALAGQKVNAEKGIWDGITTAGSAIMGWQQNKDEMKFWDKYLNSPTKGDENIYNPLNFDPSEVARISNP